MKPLAMFYRDLRIQQAATRFEEWNRIGEANDEFRAMDRKEYEKKSKAFFDEVGNREFTWDAHHAPDIMEPIDWLRLEPCFIRDWILNCKLEPHEACDGIFHQRRKWFKIWERWDWATFGSCPIRDKEKEIEKNGGSE
jgi:hypothetical protein